MLKRFDLKTLAEAPKLVGIGEAEHVSTSLTWLEHHAIMLSATEDIQADRVVIVSEEFRDQMVALQGGAKIPMRVFSVPCERVI